MFRKGPIAPPRVTIALTACLAAACSGSHGGGTGAAGAGSGGAGSGAAGAGASGVGAAGAGAAGAGAAGAGACPAAPPVDFDDAAMRAKCGKLVYVAGGDHFHVLVSSDGASTWTSMSPAEVAGEDYVNNIVVARGVVGIIGLPGLYTSADGGKTFALVDAVSHNGFDTYGGQFMYGAGQFVLTDNQGTYLSNDGLAWRSVVPFPDNSFPNAFGPHYHGSTFGAETYLVFQDNAAYRTLKGTTWAQGVLVSADHDVGGVAFGNGTFVVVGQAGGAMFTMTSPDGKTWGNAQTKDASGAAFTGGASGGIIFDGAKFRAYRQYSDKVSYVSSDGTSWTKVTLSNDVDAVAYADGHYFAVGDKNLLTSSDGVAWTMVHAFTAQETFAIYGPRVAVGYVLK